MVGLSKPGTKIPLEVWRKGKVQQLSVVLGELPAENPLAGKSSKAFSRGGLALSELSEEQRRALDVDHGLLVEDATGDAARAGIRTGDVILAVNNSKVSSVAGVPQGHRCCAGWQERGDSGAARRWLALYSAEDFG